MKKTLLTSLDQVMTEHPFLPWKVRPTQDGGRIATALLTLKDDTRLVFMVMENTTAPYHEHTAGGAYGERVTTVAGRLGDMLVPGRKTLLEPGQHIEHTPGSRHAPQATFWFGYYHQPCGSTLVTS